MRYLIPMLIFLAFMPPIHADVDPVRVSPVVRALGQAGPAVVNISTEKVVSVTGANPFGDEWIFNYFEPSRRRNITNQSLGSGTIIQPDGIILTNEHIILPASKITVTLASGQEYEAELLGASRRLDLALLKITAPEPLPYIAPFTSNDLMIGETVIAIGNPYGLSNTVTTGVVSALNRSLTFKDRTNETHTYHDFIQTDAAINPGNSGGPLLNVKGELIGINTAIYENAKGIGFAIPIDKAKRVIKDLLEIGTVPRPWLGIHTQDLTPVLAKHLRVDRDEGALVSEVSKGSPAERAEIRAGDVIIGLGKYTVTSSDDFRDQLLEVLPGDSIRITILRGGKEYQADITAEALPTRDPQQLTWEILGLSLKEIKVDGGRGNPEKGVYVNEVRPGSPADDVGIRSGDALLQIDRTRIVSADAFYQTIMQGSHRDSVMLIVVRGNMAYRVTPRLE